MGGVPSRPTAVGAPHHHAHTSSSPSVASVSSAREHAHWLHGARVDRLLDDAFVSEWHKKNDLAAHHDKERKRHQRQATGGTSNTLTTDAAGTLHSSSARRSDDHSEVYEQLYSYLGPNFAHLQSSRLAAIVHEVDAACESAAAKSSISKREWFVRRIHAAIDAQRQANAKRTDEARDAARDTHQADSTTTASDTTVTTAQQEEELKKLPLPQQLSIRWLLSMLHTLRRDDAATADPSLVTFFLTHLLPLLDDLLPLLASDERGHLGALEAIEQFLTHIFKDQLHAATSTSGESTDEQNSAALVRAEAASFPLAQVTSSLLALALSRARFSTILSILQPILLSHISPTPILDSLTCKPQPLLTRLRTIEGPAASAYNRGARRGSLSSGAPRPAGSLFAWGTSQNTGKLGFGSLTATKKTPTVLGEFTADRVLSVSTFQNHVLVVDRDHRVYGFGSNNETFRLGLDEIGNRSSPTLLPALSDKRIVQVSVGNEFSACLTATGQVYCFGDGQNLKLGHGQTTSSKSPVLVSALAGVHVTAIACGGFHTLALTSGHEVYSWGKGSRGCLGLGTTADSNPHAIKSFSGVPLKQAACGWEHSLVLTADGLVFAFGGGYDNRPVTGLGEGADQKTPKQVKALAGQEVSYIACGWDHSLFLTADGGAWACGDGSGGRLGCGDVSDQPLPKRLRGFTGADGSETKIVSCDGGEGHSTFIGIDGSVWSAGTDGTNAAAIKTVPTKMECSRPIRFVTCGGKVTFGLSGLPAIGGPTSTSDAEEVHDDSATTGFFDTPSVLSHPSMRIPNHPLTTRTTKLTALLLLAQIDRLAAQQKYERDATTTSASRDDTRRELLTAPYCIDATPATLDQLFAIVRAYTRHVSHQMTEADRRRVAGLPPLQPTSIRINTESAAATAEAILSAKAAKAAEEIAAIAACKDVHRSVTCDGCRQSPLIGARWKCNQCNCNTCKLTNRPLGGHTSSHTFTRYAVSSGAYVNSQPIVSTVDPDPDDAEEVCDWHDSYVLIATIRLLKANFTRLVLAQGTIGGTNTDASADPSHLFAASTRFSVGDLQSYLLQMVDGEFGFPVPSDDTTAVHVSSSDAADSASSAASPSPSSHARSLADSLRSEAVNFLRVGLEVFYPSHASKETLVSSLLDSASTRSRFLAPSLLARLAEDRFVDEFVPEIIRPMAQKKPAQIQVGPTRTGGGAASSAPSSASGDISPMLVVADSDVDGSVNDVEPEDGGDAAQAEVDAANASALASSSSVSFSHIDAHSQSLLSSTASLAAQLQSESAQSAQLHESSHALGGDEDGSVGSVGSEAHDEEDAGESVDGDGGDLDSISVPASHGDSAVLTPFNCLICTFANEAGFLECQICGSPRPPNGGSAEHASDDDFHAQLMQMQAQIQREQAELMAEQVAAMENQQLMLAQQMSNAAAEEAASAAAAAGNSDAAQVSADAASGVSNSAPVSSPSSEVRAPPSSLFAVISSLSSPQQPSFAAGESAASEESSATASMQLMSPSMSQLLASPSQGAEPRQVIVFDDDDAAPSEDESKQTGGVSLSSPMPSPADSPSSSQASRPSARDAAAAVDTASSDEDESASIAAYLAQSEAQFKSHSKQLSTLLHRLVTATALDMRAQLSSIGASSDTASWTHPPAAAAGTEPRLQFLLALQTRTLSWAASCAEQYQKEKEKERERATSTRDAAAANSPWLAAYHRTHLLSHHTLRDYAELVLDAALELCEQAATVISDKCTPATGAPAERDGTTFFPAHVLSLLRDSLVGVLLPSLLLALGLFPSSSGGASSSLAASLSTKYVSLLRTTHQLSLAMTSLAQSVSDLQRPSKEKERADRRARKEEREREKGRSREEKEKKRIDKKRQKGDNDSAAPSDVSADSTLGGADLKDDSAASSAAADAIAQLISSDHLSAFSSLCSSHLTFLGEVEREASWLMATILEGQLTDEADSVDEEPAEDHAISTDATIRPPVVPLMASAPELSCLSSDLLKLGLEDGSVGFDEDADGADPDDEEDALDTPAPLELSRRLTPSSRSAHITADDAVRFCIDLGDSVGVAARLWEWMTNSHLRREVIGKPDPWLDRTARCAFAALLKHHGLVAEAISYGRLIVRKGATLATTFLPAPELIAAWREAQNIRLACLRRAQEITQQRAIARDQHEATVSGGGDEEATTRDNHTVSSQEAACRPVLTCAGFLLRVSPSLESVSARSAAGPFSTTASFLPLPSRSLARGGRTTSSKWSLLRTLFRVIHRIRFLKFQAALDGFERTYIDRSCFKQTRHFLTSDVDCDRLEQLMAARSRRAVRRLHALRQFQSLLGLLPAPICQVELLGGIRRSMYQRNILDGIDGCGPILIASVRRQFGKLMGDVTRILLVADTAADETRDPTAVKDSGSSMIGLTLTSTPASVRLAALGCWVFTLRHDVSDHALIAQVGIIPAVQSLLGLASRLQNSTVSSSASDDSSRLSPSDYRDAKKLVSISWKVLKLLACELGIGVRTNFVGDDTHAHDAQLDQHSPFLETVLEALYAELHRAVSAWARGDVGPTSVPSHHSTSSSSRLTLKEIPVFGAPPLTRGCIDLVRGTHTIHLKPTVLGFTYDITNPSGSPPAANDTNAELAKTPSKSTPQKSTSATPGSKQSNGSAAAPASGDFTVAMWIFLAREAGTSSSSSSSSSSTPLLALRATAGSSQFAPALVVNDADARLKVLVSTVGGSTGGSGTTAAVAPEVVISANKLPTRKWVHLCVTLAEKTVTIFINGEVDTSKSLANVARPFSAAEDQLHIGRARSRLASAFPTGVDGQVGGVSFWHRAISSSNVSDLVSRGHPRANFYLNYAHRIVSLLGSLDGVPCLLTRKWMSLFLWLLQHGEVGVQVRVMRILRRLLPNLSPKKAQSLLITDATNATTSLTSPMATLALDDSARVSTPTTPVADTDAVGLQAMEDENGERLVRYLFDLANASSLPLEDARVIREEWAALSAPTVAHAPSATDDGAGRDSSSSPTAAAVASLLPTLLHSTPAQLQHELESESESTVAAEAIMLLRHLMLIPTSVSTPSSSLASSLPSSSPKLSPSLSPSCRLPQNTPAFWPIVIRAHLAQAMKEVPQSLQAKAKQTESLSSASSADASSAVSSLVSSFTRALTSLDLLGGHLPILRLGAAAVIKATTAIPTAHHHQSAHVVGWEANRQSAEVALQTITPSPIAEPSGSDSPLPPLPMTATCDISWLQPCDEIAMTPAQATPLLPHLLPIARIVVREYEQQISRMLQTNPPREDQLQPNASSSSPSESSTGADSPTPIVSDSPTVADVILSQIGSRLLKVLSSLLSDSTIAVDFLSAVPLRELVFIAAMPVMVDASTAYGDTAAHARALEEQRLKLWQTLRRVSGDVNSDEARADSQPTIATKAPKTPSPTPPTISASPSSPPSASRSPQEVEQELKISDLAGMGFDRDFCRRALQRTNWNASNAADWLLTHMDQLESERRREEEAAKIAALTQQVAAEKAALETDCQGGDARQLRAILDGLVATPTADIRPYTPDTKDTLEEYFEVDFFPASETSAALLDIHATNTAATPTPAAGAASRPPAGAATTAASLTAAINGLGSMLMQGDLSLLSGGVSLAALAHVGAGGTLTSAPSEQSALKSSAADAVSITASGGRFADLADATPKSLLSSLQRVDAALTILYARATVLALLRHCPSDVTITQAVSSLGADSLLTRFFKLAGFRQSTPESIAVRAPDDTHEATALKYLLANSASLRAFVVEEALRHLTKAATPPFAAVAWGRRRLEESDVSALTSPRVEFAEWTLATVVDIEERRAARLTVGATEHSDAAISLPTMQRLILCMDTPNLCLRWKVVNLLNTILRVQWRRSFASAASTAGAAAIAAVASVMPTDKIDLMMNKRIKSEEGKLVSSAYATAMLQLAATVQAIKERHDQLERDAQQSADGPAELTQAAIDAYLQQAPSLHLESTFVHGVDLSWSVAAPPRLTDADVDRFHFVLELSESAPSITGSAAAASEDSQWEVVYVGPGTAWMQEGLAEHTAYRLRVSLVDTQTHVRGMSSAPLSVQTAASLQWSLASASDAGCSVTADGLTATYVTSASRWRTVLAARAYSTGTHSWLVKLDRMQSSAVFFGVAKSQCNKQMYVGSDMFSWSIYAKEGRRFVQNTRLQDKPPTGGLVAWRNEMCTTGDCLKLTLDCDAGLLTVQRNGSELGVAFDFLPKNEPLFPAVSFNSNGDRITITQCANTASSAISKDKSKSTPAATATDANKKAAANAVDTSVVDWRSRTVRRMHWCTQFLDAITHQHATPFPASVAQLAYARAVQFAQQTSRHIELADGSRVQIDLSPSACGAAGVTLGQAVQTKTGSGTVIGVEVVGRLRRREIAARLSQQASSGWSAESDRQAATAAAMQQQAEITWNELMGADDAVTSGDVDRCHPAAFRHDNRSALPTPFDALLAHPAAIVVSDTRDQSSPSSLFTTPVSSGSSSLMTPIKTAGVSRQLSSMFSSARPTPIAHTGAGIGIGVASPTIPKIAFSALKEPRIWIKINGADDPICVHQTDLTVGRTQGESKEEEKETEQKESDSPQPTATAETSNTPDEESSLGLWTYSHFLSLLHAPSFTRTVDVQLVHYINDLADCISCPPAALVLHDIRTHPPNRQLHPLLADITIDAIIARFSLLQTFNSLVGDILLDVDRPPILADAARTRARTLSLGAHLARHRDLLLTRVKLTPFQTMITETATYTKPSEDPYELAPGIKTITLNRHKAAKARERGSVQSRLRHSLVGQTQAEIGHWPPSDLRRHYTKMDDGGQIRTFVVKFAGEGVRDNGGVYTELQSSLVEELLAPDAVLPFFIRTPNSRAAIGDNQDWWMPNPSQTSHAALATYRFIGQMIGVAMRGKTQLAFNLAPLFWKVIVGQPATIADLEECDQTIVHTFDAMKAEAQRRAADTNEDDDDPSSFGELFGLEGFTSLLSDGLTKVELTPGGASRPVTVHNYREWIDLCTSARLRESTLQINALRTGLASVVPTHLFGFFTWSELQRLVCGLADFPIALLQSITRYEGKMHADIEYVKWFWSVLDEMSPHQKSQFMRFVFARDRLPPRPAELGIHFKIQDPLSSTTANPDAHFPSTHTCFFSLSLPHYCLAFSTPVLRPDGTHSLVEKLRVGDHLVGSTGESVPITCAQEGYSSDMYRIEYQGSSHEVTPDHLLVLRWSRDPLVRIRRSATHEYVSLAYMDATTLEWREQQLWYISKCGAGQTLVHHASKEGVPVDSLVLPRSMVPHATDYALWWLDQKEAHGEVSVLRRGHLFEVRAKNYAALSQSVRRHSTLPMTAGLPGVKTTGGTDLPSSSTFLSPAVPWGPAVMVDDERMDDGDDQRKTGEADEEHSDWKESPAGQLDDTFGQHTNLLRQFFLDTGRDPLLAASSTTTSVQIRTNDSVHGAARVQLAYTLHHPLASESSLDANSGPERSHTFRELGRAWKALDIDPVAAGISISEVSQPTIQTEKTELIATDSCSLLTALAPFRGGPGGVLIVFGAAARLCWMKRWRDVCASGTIVMSGNAHAHLRLRLAEDTPVDVFFAPHPSASWMHDQLLHVLAMAHACSAAVTERALRASSAQHPLSRPITSVHPVAGSRYMAVEVGTPDGLFVLADGVVTHNSSREVLQSKLLYAMNMCTSMDGDLVLKESELYDWNADDIK